MAPLSTGATVHFDLSYICLNDRNQRTKVQCDQPIVCAAVIVASRQRAGESAFLCPSLLFRFRVTLTPQMVEITKGLHVGQPDDPSSFMSAVIDQRYRA